MYSSRSRLLIGSAGLGVAMLWTVLLVGAHAKTNSVFVKSVCVEPVSVAAMEVNEQSRMVGRDLAEAGMKGQVKVVGTQRNATIPL